MTNAIILKVPPASVKTKSMYNRQNMLRALKMSRSHMLSLDGIMLRDARKCNQIISWMSYKSWSRHRQYQFPLNTGKGSLCHVSLPTSGVNDPDLCIHLMSSSLCISLLSLSSLSVPCVLCVYVCLVNLCVCSMCAHVCCYACFCVNACRPEKNFMCPFHHTKPHSLEKGSFTEPETRLADRMRQRFSCLLST